MNAKETNEVVYHTSTKTTSTKESETMGLSSFNSVVWLHDCSHILLSLLVFKDKDYIIMSFVFSYVTCGWFLYGFWLFSACLTCLSSLFQDYKFYQLL